jgi:hypothetical protein
MKMGRYGNLIEREKARQRDAGISNRWMGDNKTLDIAYVLMYVRN